MADINQILGLLYENNVIESGVLDGWKYKKYGDGSYKAEKDITVNTGAFSSGASGGAAYKELDLPAPPIAGMLVRADTVISAGGASGVSCAAAGTTMKYLLFKPAAAGTNTSAQTPTIRFKAEGQWDR